MKTAIESDEYKALLQASQQSTETVADKVALMSPALSSLNRDDLVAIIGKIIDSNRETTIAAIQEMKKLSPEDQAKVDREKQQLMEATLRRVEAAKLQEEEINERQSSCSHTMPNGQTNFRGQVNSNGWAHVFCSHCHKSYDFEATDVEANKSGLNVDKWGPAAHTIIRNRAAASLNLMPPHVPRVPPGATIIFG